MPRRPNSRSRCQLITLVVHDVCPVACLFSTRPRREVARLLSHVQHEARPRRRRVEVLAQHPVRNHEVLRVERVRVPAVAVGEARHVHLGAGGVEQPGDDDDVWLARARAVGVGGAVELGGRREVARREGRVEAEHVVLGLVRSVGVEEAGAELAVRPEQRRPPAPRRLATLETVLHRPVDVALRVRRVAHAPRPAARVAATARPAPGRPRRPRRRRCARRPPRTARPGRVGRLGRCGRRPWRSARPGRCCCRARRRGCSARRRSRCGTSPPPRPRASTACPPPLTSSRYVRAVAAPPPRLSRL